MTATKTRSGCGCLPLVALVALVGGGALYYFRGNLLGKELTPIEAAQAIPQDAVLTSYISTDPQDWSKLSQFGTPEAKNIFNKQLEQIKKELSTQPFNYEQDIKPWIGGVMFAFLPGSSGGSAEVLTIVGIKNKLKAAEFEQKILKQPGQTVTKSKHQGIDITTVKDDQKGTSSSFALLNSYLLVSDQPETIQKGIDAFKGSSSYAKKEGVKSVLTQRTNLNNPLIQVYLPDYPGLIQQALSSNPSTPIDPKTLQQIQAVKSMVIGAGVENEGIRFQAIANLDPSISLPPSQNNNNKLINRFPSDTFIFVNGQGIKEGWKHLITQSEKDQALKDLIAQIRQNLQTVGLDADTEVFGWMDGEFALGMLFTDKSSIPTAGIGGALMWETSDGQTAEKAFGKLGAIAQFYNLKVTETDANGVKVTQWETGEKQPILSYGLVDNKFFTTALMMPFSPLTEVKENTALGSSENFKTITNSLPKTNVGYFYFDMDKTRGEITKIAQQQNIPLDTGTMAVLESIQGFAATGTMPDKTTSQLDMLLALKSSK